MLNYNKVIIAGSICTDIEIKEKNDHKYAKFVVAVNGKGKTETNFVKTILWDSKADIVEKYFKKGNNIMIEGELSVQKYQKDGKTQEYVTVIGNAVFFIENKSSSKMVEENPNDELPL